MMMLPERYNIVFVNADSEKQQDFLGRSLGRHMGMTDQGIGQEHTSTALSSLPLHLIYEERMHPKWKLPSTPAMRSCSNSES